MQVIRHPIFPPAETAYPPLNTYSSILCCSGSCGRIGAANLHMTASTNVSSNSAIVRGSGTHTWLFEVVAGISNLTPDFVGTFSQRTLRFYLYFETLPSADALICFASNTSGFPNYHGIAFKQSDSKLYTCLYSTFGGSFSFGATGVSVTTGVWYRIDIKISDDTVNVVVDAKVDGVALGQKSNATITGTLASLTFGHVTNRTLKYRIADIIITSAVADYPIGAGIVRRFVLTSDGTHNTGAAGSFIVGAAGANITDATTNSYLLVDDTPLDDTTPDVDDYITQTNNTGGGALYVEHSFDSPDAFTPVNNPRGVDCIVAYHAAGTGIGNSTFKINDNGTESNILAFSGAGQTTIRYARNHFANPPSGLGGWKLTGFNGNFNLLKHRFGYSTDGDPDQYFDCVMMEAEFAE